MPYQVLGTNTLSSLTASTGLYMRHGGISASTSTNPIIITDDGTPADHGMLLGTITNISYNPLTIESDGHGLTSGDRIVITGFVTGNLVSLNNVSNAALGQFNTWQVRVIDANNFSVYNGPVPFERADFMDSETDAPVWIRPELMMIENHLVNTNANGIWLAAPASSNGFVLTGSVHNGSGASTGTWRTMPYGTNAVLLQALVAPINWRDDGTAPAAGSSDKELYPGDEPLLFTGNIWQFHAINQTASSGAVLACEFLKL